MSMEKRRKKTIAKVFIVIVFCVAFFMTMYFVEAKAYTFTPHAVTPPVPVVTAQLTPSKSPINNNIAQVETVPLNGSLSFNFQDISVRALLQLIAQRTERNFIISDSVKGSVGFSLYNVTWNEALAALLRSQNLDSRKFGNVLMIAPIDELAANDVKRMQAKQQLLSLSPSVSAIIRLRYANANDLAKVISSPQSNLLSANGQVGVDPRTNAIWIRDNQVSLAKVRGFIRQLDIPVKQVMIEARIVSIDKKYAEEIGVRWGVTDPNNLSGTLPGANAMQQGTAPANIPIDQRLNFNLPAASAGVFGATPASAGLALLKIGKAYLDLELSALEAEKHAEIISNPRIITSNLEKASIQTGEEIPYQESTSSGATNVAFKNAVLSLEVTPQITKNNSVVLSLKVTQDKRGTDVSTGSGGVIPSIDTQELLSHVQLRSGETVVIGGVYKKINNNTVERIPFLGGLPLVGYLFRYTHVDTENNELLIFITPKVITQANIEKLTEHEKQVGLLSLDSNLGFSTPIFSVKPTTPVLPKIPVTPITPITGPAPVTPALPQPKKTI